MLAKTDNESESPEGSKLHVMTVEADPFTFRNLPRSLYDIGPTGIRRGVGQGRTYDILATHAKSCGQRNDTAIK